MSLEPKGPAGRMSLIASHVAASGAPEPTATNGRAVKVCPALKLARTGNLMPVVGLGTWKIERGESAKVVEDAIRAGYRHIDCACDYGNEKEVGQGIQAAIKAGVCSRADLWITSKLWNTYHRREHVRAACEKDLSDLGLEYLDLYLIHFPISLKFVPFETRYPPEWVHDPSAPEPKMEMDEGVSINDTWAGMEELVEAGLVRNIGVCNFNVQLLQHLRSIARIPPQVNQVELHPFLVQEQLLRYCAHVGIAVTGFSPLGSGSYEAFGWRDPKESVLLHPTVAAISQKLGKTPAQVVLRWATLRGYSVVAKSSKTERQLENLSLFDFQLSAEDIASITALDRGLRYNDPGVFSQGMGACCPIHG
mmetsp:Transcript_50334/g.81605  ORF Transcript_50334/g.81605 Transcript_50334/m.81605 type:complete len:364 (+) Transcript_50334:47-1138(+)